MSADNKLSKGKKVLSVIIGTLLVGFMWRARGISGFGSSWGLIYVASVITMLIFSFYGNRAKIKYELLPIGTLMMALTVPAWGEINQMMGGIIPDRNISEIGEELAVINGFHALPLLIMTGFSLICLYSIFVGTLFSKKDAGLSHYIVYIAVFFIVSYTAKFTYSHYLLRLIAPEVSNSFASTLSSVGENLTLKQFYIRNILNLSAFTKLPYGRAYNECIAHIATASGAVAVLLTSLVIFRDKITFLVSLVIDIFAAVGITVSDVFNISGYNGPGSVLKSINLPSVLNVVSWPLWEYLTGASIGFGIMFIIALLPDSLTAGRKYRNEAVIKNKYIRFIYSLLFVFVFGLFAEPVRCFGIRLSDTLEMFGFISESKNEIVSYTIMAIAGVAAFIPVFMLLKKNIIDKNLPVPVRMKPSDFCLKFLPLYVLVALVFFLLPDEAMKENLFALIKNPTGINILSGEYPNIIAACSALLFFVLFMPVRKRILSHH